MGGIGKGRRRIGRQIERRLQLLMYRLKIVYFLRQDGRFRQHASTHPESNKITAKARFIFSYMPTINSQIQHAMHHNQQQQANPEEAIDFGRKQVNNRKKNPDLSANYLL
jgi:hypothetical protein